MNRSCVVAVDGEAVQLNFLTTPTHHPKPVNLPFPPSFLLLSLPVLAVTLGLNTGVTAVLAGKESTTVNKLMLMDCLAAIPMSVIGTFQQSQLYRGLDNFYCVFHLLLSTTCNIFNRVVPVAIVLFRSSEG